MCFLGVPPPTHLHAQAVDRHRRHAPVLPQHCLYFFPLPQGQGSFRFGLASERTGSTGGGMKVIRLLLILKHGKTEIKKLLHPRAVFLVKVSKIRVRPEVMLNVLGFFTLYIALFIFCSFLMAAMGLDMITATSSVAATLGNIGPGLAKVGPALNYSEVPLLGKWILCMCMLLGRLEIFTVIILFMPGVWKKF